MTPEAITDTHLHVVDRARLRYPWISGTPALDRDWLIESYEAEARSIGIAQALHMEVDVASEDIEAEIDYVENLCRREGSIVIGIIAACRPESDGFAAQLERAQDRPHVVGFRRVLHVAPDDTSRSVTFRASMDRLAEADLPFDLCVLARQLPLAIELADASPRTRFVLDHCGVPDIAADAWASWASDIAALAKRPNVSAKISGIPAYAAPGWTDGELARWMIHVIACFGFDRLVWGGDWPVCTLGGGLTSWVSATRAILAGASAEERTALYSGNAARIWGL